MMLAWDGGKNLMDLDHILEGKAIGRDVSSIPIWLPSNWIITKALNTSLPHTTLFSSCSSGLLTLVEKICSIPGIGKWAGSLHHGDESHLLAGIPAQLEPLESPRQSWHNDRVSPNSNCCIQSGKCPLF